MNRSPFGHATDLNLEETDIVPLAADFTEFVGVQNRVSVSWLHDAYLPDLEVWTSHTFYGALYPQPQNQRAMVDQLRRTILCAAHALTTLILHELAVVAGYITTPHDEVPYDDQRR